MKDFTKTELCTGKIRWIQLDGHGCIGDITTQDGIYEACVCLFDKDDIARGLERDIQLDVHVEFEFVTEVIKGVTHSYAHNIRPVGKPAVRLAICEWVDRDGGTLKEACLCTVCIGDREIRDDAPDYASEAEQKGYSEYCDDCGAERVPAPVENQEKVE